MLTKPPALTVDAATFALTVGLLVTFADGVLNEPRPPPPPSPSAELTPSPAGGDSWRSEAPFVVPFGARSELVPVLGVPRSMRTSSFREEDAELRAMPALKIWSLP